LRVLHLLGETALWPFSRGVRVAPPPAKIPLKMKLATELQIGSTCYNAVLAHEQRHIADGQSILELYAARLKDDLDPSILPRATYPILLLSASAEAAQDELFRRVAGIVQKDLDLFKAQADQKGKAVDTQAEYDAVQKQCPGW
jgi:hypothetical protein